MNKINLER